MANADYSNEIWKDIPGWEGFYQASTLGRVRSLDRPARGRQPVIGRILQPSPATNGYLHVSLSRPGGGRRTHKVHRLVCLTFHGPQPANHCVAHGDGCRTNNRPENLRWATLSENQRDRITHGTHMRGQAHKLALFTNEQAQELRCRWQAGESFAALAREVGCHKDTMRNVCRRRTYATND